jgi:hypothetical protein
MTVTFSQPKTFTDQRGQTKQLSSIKVFRIIDIPEKKLIKLFTAEVGFLDLPSLSGDSYDNPPWTNSLVIQALQDLNSISPSSPPVQNDTLSSLTNQ